MTKDRVFPDPVADWMMASLLLFRTLVALFCTSAQSKKVRKHLHLALKRGSL